MSGSWKKRRQDQGGVVLMAGLLLLLGLMCGRSRQEDELKAETRGEGQQVGTADRTRPTRAEQRQERRRRRRRWDQC